MVVCGLQKEVAVDEDDWGDEDVSEEAVAKRMLELTDAAKTMAMSEELEKTENERMDLFYTFVKVTGTWRVWIMNAVLWTCLIDFISDVKTGP